MTTKTIKGQRSAMRFPVRMTFQWLWENVPQMDADEFLDLIDVLEERRWINDGGHEFGANFYGMLYYGLRPGVRRAVDRSS